MENKKTIGIGKKKITICKMAFGDYAIFTRKLLEAKGAIKALFEMGEITQNKIINALPEIISESFPQLIEIISFASGIPKKKFSRSEDGEYYGLSETVLILKTVLEVNDFNEIKKNIGNILSTEEKNIKAESKELTKNG